MAYPGILFGRGGSTNSVEDRENGDVGAVAPYSGGSGGSCNLVQEISFHIVKCLNFLYFNTIYDDTNLFVIANVKQLQTGGSFRILMPFFRTSWCVGFLNSAIFLTVFTIGLSLARFWGAFGISGGGVEPPNSPPPTSVCHWYRKLQFAREATSK